MSDLFLGLNSVAMDTDVASLYHKEQLQPATLAKMFGFHKVLPFVVVGELTAWTEMRARGPGRIEELRMWLDESPVIPGDDSVATLWIGSAAKRAGKTTQVNDTWIAACCLAYGLPLVTRNTKDYQYFADHHGLILL